MHWNCEGIIKNYNNLNDIIKKLNYPQVIGLSETWLM